MKSKKMTYLLIVCVAGVWGIIFFKIYSGLSSNEEQPVFNVKKEKAGYFNLADHRMDGLHLDFNYRDPFSMEMPVPEEKVKPEKQSYSGTTLPVQNSFKPQVNWSAVQYKGYISNPVTKKKVAIMVVNGKETMLSEGENAHGIRLIRFAGDSVRVAYQQEIKYILIK